MRAYKLLANNDTARARGHQAGPLIPKAIASYFPALPNATPPGQPTVDALIDAELWLGSMFVANVKTRYQHQTWHGSRRPERRITGSLAPLLSHAKKDDLLVMEQITGNKYRLTLHKVGTAPYTSVSSGIHGRWGFIP